MARHDGVEPKLRPEKYHADDVPQFSDILELLAYLKSELKVQEWRDVRSEEHRLHTERKGTDEYPVPCAGRQRMYMRKS